MAKAAAAKRAKQPAKKRAAAKRAPARKPAKGSKRPSSLGELLKPGGSGR